MKHFKQKAIAVSGLVFGGITSAYAALPSSVTTTITAAQSDASDIFNAVFPVIGVVVGMTLVIKLFKKFTNKI